MEGHQPHDELLGLESPMFVISPSNCTSIWIFSKFPCSHLSLARCCTKTRTKLRRIWRGYVWPHVLWSSRALARFRKSSEKSLLKTLPSKLSFGVFLFHRKKKKQALARSEHRCVYQLEHRQQCSGATIQIFFFLDAFSHLYKRVCRSVGPSVRRSVDLSHTS